MGYVAFASARSAQEAIDEMDEEVSPIVVFKAWR